MKPSLTPKHVTDPPTHQRTACEGTPSLSFFLFQTAAHLKINLSCVAALFTFCPDARCVWPCQDFQPLFVEIGDLVGMADSSEAHSVLYQTATLTSWNTPEVIGMISQLLYQQLSHFQIVFTPWRLYFVSCCEFLPQIEFLIRSAGFLNKMFSIGWWIFKKCTQ